MSIVINPVAESLFAIVDGEPRLLGSVCTGCSTQYFPQALSCRNPQCRDKNIEMTPLPRRGTLVSFTIQRYQPPALFRQDDWKPYGIGLVDLGNGLEVMGMLTDVSLDKIAIGTTVQLKIGALFKDPERGEVHTYMFAPMNDEVEA